MRLSPTAERHCIINVIPSALVCRCTVWAVDESPMPAMLKVFKMLVVPVLLGVLLFSIVTAGSYVSPPSRRCSPLNACIANLKQIDGAKAIWALEHDKRTNDVPAWSDIIRETNYLSRIPKCPSRGTYTLRSVGEPPACSVPGHALP